jgi:hypothetical protein
MAVMRRVSQGGVPGGVNVGTGLEEGLDGFALASRRGFLERRAHILMAISPAFKKGFHAAGMAFCGGEV